MLYIVEFDILDRELWTEFDTWYLNYVNILLSTPGILSAQRFASCKDDSPRFFNIYTIESMSALESREYKSRAGPANTEKWGAVFENWKRNVFEGVTFAPEVKDGGLLSIVDREKPEDTELPGGFTRLRPVGLDRTMVERGIRFDLPGDSGGTDGEAPDRSRIFAPVTARLLSRAWIR